MTLIKEVKLNGFQTQKSIQPIHCISLFVKGKLLSCDCTKSPKNHYLTYIGLCLSKMNHEPKRYIADIEIPEGFATIDCEVEVLDPQTDQARITLILASCSYKNEETEPVQGNLTLREELDLFLEAIRITDRKDLKGVIEELLREAYGKEADITVSSIDMD